MNKKTLTTLLLMALTFSANADNEVLINGNKMEKDAAKLEFDGDKATIEYSDGSTFNYDMEEVEIFFTLTSSAKNAANFLKLNSVVTDEMQISGLNGSEKLEVRNTLGETLLSHKANAESVTLDLRTLSKGVYLLKLDNQSVKFIKK
ncbi:MAG: T9SS type A sorting domain-containing protein [Paludibacteraceae bacterium]|nr:T9SS type A sorting domain-containing protein [Paludibacteraceae bacterium]